MLIQELVEDVPEPRTVLAQGIEHAFGIYAEIALDAFAHYRLLAH
jgi:hypothetical protein